LGEGKKEEEDFKLIECVKLEERAGKRLHENERREVWEICEDRYQTRSTVLTSQLPVSRWHEQIGDPTIADGILDRLVHNAHRIEMRGESMRKKRHPPPDEKKE
jgi:DNA replication protein DnaC